MDLYLDLSFLSCYLVSALSLNYVTKLVPPKKRRKGGYFICTLLLIPLLLSRGFSWLTLLILLLAIFYCYRKKMILPSFLMITIYFILSNFLIAVSNGYLFYNALAVVVIPQSLIHALWLPAGWVLMLILAGIINFGKKLSQFLVRFFLIVEGKKWALKGYLDSGNDARYQGLPVIFLAESLVQQLGLPNYRFTYSTIDGEQVGVGFKASAIINGQVREVIAACSTRDSFHGCPCLLNVLLV